MLQRPDALRLALFLLCIVSISRVHQHFQLTAIRPALLLAGFASLYAIMVPRALAAGPLLRPWPTRVVLAIGLLACLGAPFGLSMGGSAKFFMNEFSKVLLFALLLMVAIRRAADLALFIWAYVLSAAILVWMSLSAFDMAAYYGSHTMRLETEYMFDANDLGLVLTIALPLAILVFQQSAWRGRLLSAAVLVGIGVTIARSGSRGAFIGLGFVGLALLVAMRHVSIVKRVAFIGAVVGGLLIAAPPGYWDQMRTMLTPTEDYNWSSRSGRRELTKRGLQYTMRYPLFGVGLGNFPRAEGTISEHALNPDGQGVRWTAPHNSFLQITSELGVGGFLLFSTLVFGGIIGVSRLRRRLPAHWARGDPEERFLYAATLYVPVSMLGFAVTGSFVSFAYTDPVYVLAAYTAGLYRCVELKLASTSTGAAPVATPVRRARGRGGLRTEPGALPALPALPMGTRSNS